MDSKLLNQYGAIGVSILTLLIFTALVVVALVLKNDPMLQLLTGAAISMATSAVSYWVGSSSGSARKDDALVPPAPPAGGH